MRGGGGGGSGGDGWVVVPQPAGSFMASRGMEREEHFSSFDDSVNAVSFGFVATAILISMFLLMAIFEKFIRARSAAQRPMTQTVAHIESGRSEWNGKLGHPSPKAATVYAKEVSVVMPGEKVPTFIAHPAPPPCQPERISWPLHLHHSDQRSPCVPASAPGYRRASPLGLSFRSPPPSSSWTSSRWPLRTFPSTPTLSPPPPPPHLRPGISEPCLPLSPPASSPSARETQT